MERIILLIVCAVGLVSCSINIVASPDFDLLPHNRGETMNSLELPPWQYGASDASWHHFYYSWSDKNSTRTRRVKIRRDLISLPFERPVSGYYKAVWVEPVLEDGRILTFKTAIGQYPRQAH